jgi:dTMP kinase
VVIDGLDASGKSTQATLLSRFLTQEGQTVFLRIHPSDDNYVGIRAKHFLYLRGKGAHFAAAFFYMLDVIRSILLYSWQKYDYIIFVRYLMGTAYLPAPVHRIAYHFFATIVPTSDLMFFLDVKPKEAYTRIQLTREKLEMFESHEELEQTRQKALSLALIDDWTVLNANQPIAGVQAKIRKSMQHSKI